MKKSTATLYWYGGGSDALLETDLSGGLQNEYIFFGGKRVARRDAAGNVFYYFADHLGSSWTAIRARDISGWRPSNNKSKRASVCERESG